MKEIAIKGRRRIKKPVQLTSAQQFFQHSLADRMTAIVIAAATRKKKTWMPF